MSARRRNSSPARGAASGSRFSRRDLEKHIANLARLFGWRHHHDVGGRTAQGYADGFPSETLIRRDRLMFAFLTSRRGGLIPPEQAWLEALRDVTTVEVHAFGPGDTADVSDVLRAEEGR
jgi:hypothetical protein